MDLKWSSPVIFKQPGLYIVLVPARRPEAGNFCFALATLQQYKPRLAGKKLDECHCDSIAYQYLFEK